MFKNSFLCLMLGLSSTFVYAKDPLAPKTYQVQPHTVQQVLYYNGTISPIANSPVLSPTAGIVDKMYFRYGQMLHKGQKLVHLQSSKLLADTRSAYVDYLSTLTKYQQFKDWQNSDEVLSKQYQKQKAHRALIDAKDTYLQNKHLYQLEVISHQELQTSKNAYFDSQESYRSAENAYQVSLQKGQGSEFITAKLQYENAKDKYQDLQKQLSSHTITAPRDGIALIPEKDDGPKSSGKIAVGNNVEYQQTVLNIGNLQGLAIHLQVSENDINQIHIGQKATIQSDAFKGITLHGTVTEKSAQAQDSGELPSFEVTVEVEKVPSTAHDKIRAGMDAKVAISTISKGQELSIPVAMITQNKQGLSVVQKYDPKSKTSTEQIIETGRIGPKFAQVLKGLQAGDYIIDKR